MGPGLSQNPELDDSGARQAFAVDAIPAQPAGPTERWRREPKTRAVVLFLLTLLTCTLAGGPWYSVPVLAILGAHEFGHYFACIRYRVNASLPYFVPLPPFFITGTLGAFIRIRQPIPGKRALFDIGVAGPIAGFIVTVPTLFVGLMLSEVVSTPSDSGSLGLEFGEPLLLQAAAWLIFGSLGENQTIVMHPTCFAAWWGLFATALNLFPIGQLDGGHLMYAVMGRRSSLVTIAAVICAIGLTVFMSISWALWTVLMIVMLLVFGPHHPRVSDEDVPLDQGRLWIAAAALGIFIVSFTPTPVDLGTLFSMM